MQLEDKIANIKQRYDIPTLIPINGIALELGVATGGFSHAILKNSACKYLYSIDRYTDRGHDDREYLGALKKLDEYRERSTLIRASFADCLHLFPDNYFDFIYIDGYAHTGQEDGKTIRDWWPKLKPGGLYCGDDYSPKWPLVIEQANAFAESKGLKLHVINCVPGDDWASKEPSWLVEKPNV